MQQDNTISIPGYLPKVDYNENFGFSNVAQYNFAVDYPNKEISFYNESDKYISYASDSLIAVWRVKSIR